MYGCLRLFSAVALLAFLVATSRADDPETVTEASQAKADPAAESEPAEATTNDAQADERETVDPSGTWKWEREFGGNTVPFELRLQWDGKTLSGEYSAFDNTSSIDDAKLDGDQLSFSVDREFDGNEFTVVFAGKVSEDAIDGTMELDFGGGEQEFDWQATRHLSIEDVVGTWQLRLETPNGDAIEPKITLTKDGDKLAGAYESMFGQREAKNVTIDGTTLSWEISGENNGNTFHAKYRGKIRGNKIAGSNDFTFGDNTRAWDFTGEKVEEPKDEPAATGEQQ